MKQNITLSIDKRLLKQARAFAAEQGLSISGLLARHLQALVEREVVYEQAKQKALAQLESPLHLGGTGIISREALHDRRGLR